MQELFNAISNLTFASFCNRIVQKENGAVEFELKHKFFSNQKPEVFCTYKVDDNTIISDTSCTLKNLDDIFEMSEPDVIKNIITIMRDYDMFKIGASLIYRIDPTKDSSSEIWRFLCGIHYLSAMKVFYT